MKKLIHEIRDPIHNFIYVSNDERKVIDSKYFQRLRYIHQLALTYLLYPAASHKRFEHSLGVMEMATRIFDVVFKKLRYKPGSRVLSSELFCDDSSRDQHRRILRYAALCHDMGHLPFSHAAEDKVFPEGQNHETITYDIIMNRMKNVWEELDLPVKESQVAKVAIGPKIYENLKPQESLIFSEKEKILTQIITSDTLGADRIDYLLRDSYHIGVAYGKFDHYRLIDCMKLCYVDSNGSGDDKTIQLGIEKGGLNSAEALMLARYYMFNQVYFHKHRRITDYHLKSFFKAWIEETMPKEVDKISYLMELTDNDVLHGIKEFAKNTDSGLALLSERILSRNHFRKAYVFSKDEMKANIDLGREVMKELKNYYNEDEIYYDTTCKTPGDPNFPVIEDDKVWNSMKISEVLPHIPTINLDTIYADKKIVQEVKDKIVTYIGSKK